MLRARHQVLLSGLAVIAMAGSVAFAADILSQFRLTEEDAQTGVFETIWRGAPDGSGSAPSIFRALSPDARATAVTAAAAFVRAYCESDAFRERYAAMRQSERPPDVPAMTLASVDVDKQAAQTKKALDDTRAALANMPPEVRKMMEAAMQEAGQGTTNIDAQLVQVEKDLGADVQKQKAAQAQASTEMAARHRSAKEFDEAYPANPEKFIALRLRAFLDLSATVAADAALARRGSKMVFVDPVLEKKPESWKQLYRAGKPSIDAARAAATAWLAALEGGVSK
jgi:hypothetical protein